MPNSRRSLIIACAITVCTSLPLFAIGALGPYFQETAEISPSLLGLAVASFTLVQAIVASVAGRVLDEVAVSSLLRASLILAALGLLAMMCTQASWIMLILGAVLGGAGAALSQPATSELLVSSTPRGSQGLAFGVVQAFKPAAVLLLGLGITILALLQSDQILVPIMAAGSCVALAVVLPRIESASRLRSRPSEGHAWSLAAVKLALLASITLGLGTTMVSFLPLSGAASGVEAGEIGLALALGSIVAIVFRVGSGALTDRGRIHPMLVVAILTIIGSLGLGLLALGGGATYLFGALLGFAGGWGSTGLLYLVAGSTVLGTAGRVTGMMVTGGAIGSTVVPLLFGHLVSVAGFEASWLALSLLGLLASAIAVSLKFRLHRLEAGASGD